MTITADRKKLQVIGITAASIVSFLALLIFLALVARSFRETGLRKAVEQVLSVSHPGMYAVGAEVYVQSSLALSLAVFSLEPTRTGSAAQEQYAAIVRITGIAGAVPAVFVCSDGLARFVGIGGFPQSQESKFPYGVTDVLVSYWEHRLPAIIGKGDL